MSFSWWCKDKDGKDLFAEFGANGQALGLAPNGEPDPSYTDGPEAPRPAYSLCDIRRAWCEFVGFADDSQKAAREAVATVQAMARTNLRSLRPHHCETCTCHELKPHGWNVAEIEKLLAVPLERVWSAGGGW